MDCSVKYYFDQVDVSNAITETPELDLPGFVYEETENGFRRFRNTAYIPMGFTFDQYISEDVWDATSESQRCPLLIRALVLSDEQVEKYGDWMKPITSQDLRMTEDEYLTECSERAASACDTFTYDSYGFQASITTEKPNLVFFSVPYEDGWSATVNGEEVPVEKVDTGFMAVPVEAGESDIVFTYETPGLRAGLWISLGGVICLVIYLLLCRKFVRRTPAEERTQLVSAADNTAKTEEPQPIDTTESEEQGV